MYQDTAVVVKFEKFICVYYFAEGEFLNEILRALVEHL